MSVQFVAVPTLDDRNRSIAPEQRMEIMVNIRASVLDVEVARRKVNAWLVGHVGNLLYATKPELILGERLVWRYDVILGVPNLAQPGSGTMYKVGQILLDAETGEIEDADKLVEELQTNASAVAR